MPRTYRNSLREFKEMVARLHDAGLEVILDVVYNHTAEGNERGPTLSFKGIDNASYYRLAARQARYYINDTGTGNTLNLSHPARDPDGHRQPALLGRSRCMSTASASISGPSWRAKPYGFDESERLSKAAIRIPCSAQVKLIAEPWDCGPGGYQVGGFPPGWAEWNDKFRDTVRDFWRGRSDRRGLAPRHLPPPRDLFNHGGRRAWASVNFITAHDGFTLNDCGQLQRQAQRSQRRRQQGRQFQQPTPGIAASRARQTTRRSWLCATARNATCWRRCCSRRARR